MKILTKTVFETIRKREIDFSVFGLMLGFALFIMVFFVDSLLFQAMAYIFISLCILQMIEGVSM